ncbi:glycoside hydrolase family 65 protein [Streptomyces sp. NPDC002004]
MTTGWTWAYNGYDPKQVRLREALCTLGNGYFATRGAAPEVRAGPVHYPGTYVAGFYNRLESTVAGRRVTNEDMVNLPNWLPLRYRCCPDEEPAGPWLTPDHPSLRRYCATLDLRSGVLTQRLLFQDRLGRRLGVTHTRIVHMGNPHLAAQQSMFRAYGWSGRIDVESALDADVANEGVARYRDLNGRHLTGHRTGATQDGTAWLGCRTTASDTGVGMAVRTTTDVPRSSSMHCDERRVVQRYTLPISRERGVRVHKTAVLYTSLDTPDPVAAALGDMSKAQEFEELLCSHRTVWAQLWNRAELRVPGEAGRILRLHTFHVLQTLSPHTAALDVGVPARGLHGEAYRGHVFWDELFVVPFLNLHFPDVARALLDYRHRRLPRACEAASAAGYHGAMFPWQSGSDGREETQRLHLNPRSGRWSPDHSNLQRHVGSAIAHNVWRYGQATGDTDFLYGRGAELLLQIARFWGCVATYDPALERYRIRGVVGPDEYHDAYPDASSPGLDDNAYTNVTAAWVLARALDLTEQLPPARREELFDRLALHDEELARWGDVSRRLRVPFHARVVSQFEGYGDLVELDWDAYRARYVDIRRLDRILEAEGDSVNRYQASKQADTLMLGYLFPPEELAGLFARLGYRLDDETWHRTVAYYLRRTSHGSTLSGLVHAWVLTRLKGRDAWRFCEEALLSDVADVQGGTTGEGIHLGAMAGTLDLVQRGLTGLQADERGLRFDPVPLHEIPRFGFSLEFRGHGHIHVRLLPHRLGISVPDSQDTPLTVRLAGGRTVTVAAGQQGWFRLPDG